MKSKKTKAMLAFLTAILITVFCAALPAYGAAAENDSVMLIPGGMAFGVKFFTQGALVIEVAGIETSNGLVFPAKEAGIREKDVIIRVGGLELKSADMLIETVEGCGGAPVSVAYERGGEEYSTSVTPALDRQTGEYKIGLLVRDSTAGIGTVTYIVPATGEFGGLGHGINDGETGVLLPLGRGAVVDVKITDIVKGVPNSPGELRGEFGSKLQGELYANTNMGVFGEISRSNRSGEAIPAASRDEVIEGEAYIITTVDGTTPQKFDIEIEKVYTASGQTKNFLIKITDPGLISLAGGIVQGMSGSPIIQNGKLVGAVTHVLVSDPLHGYGIFIENMLDAAG